MGAPRNFAKRYVKQHLFINNDTLINIPMHNNVKKQTIVRNTMYSRNTLRTIETRNLSANEILYLLSS